MQGRTIQKVTFTSFEGLRVKATYSLPASSTPAAKLPAVLIVDHRKGIPVWGNEQPWERNQWGDRAVLIVETLDRGSRALEQNLRSFSDDDLLHHMKRQAMVAGTTLESMQLYEILRSLDLLRSLLTSIQPGSRSSARVRTASTACTPRCSTGTRIEWFCSRRPHRTFKDPTILASFATRTSPKRPTHRRQAADLWRSPRPAAIRESLQIAGRMPTLTPPALCLSSFFPFFLLPFFSPLHSET